MVALRMGLIFLLILVVGGCGTTTTAPNVVSRLADNPVDQFGTGLGTNWEITQLVTTRSSSGLTVSLTFASAPLLPAAGGVATTTTVGGYVSVDADQNPATGLISFADIFCPAPPALGEEFYVYLFARNAAGAFDVFDSSTDADVGDATPSIGGNTLDLAIPLSAFGGDGQTNLAVIIGNSAEPTDCAPDSGALITRRPGAARSWGSRGR